MTRDPIRLVDLGETSDEVKDLLRSAAPLPPLPLGTLRRSAALVATLSTVKVASPGAVLGVKIGALGAALLLVAGGAEWMRRSRENALDLVRSAVPSEQRENDRPTETSIETPPLTNVPLLDETLPEPTDGSPTAHSSSTRISIDPLVAEAALLESARAALESSPRRALALTRVHARRFRSGVLGPERELLAVEALLRLGRTEAGNARALRLLEEGQGELYRERLHRILER